MTSLHPRPHRLSRFLMIMGVIELALLVSDSVLLLTTAAHATPHSDPSSSPLDLEVIALTPLDLKSRGLQPYGMGDSRYLDIDTASNLIAEIQDKSPSDSAKMLRDAGFARGYTRTNDNLTAPGQPGSNLNGFVQSTILEFPDPSSATTAYDSLTTWPVTIHVVPVETKPILGDATQLVTYTAGGGESPSRQITHLTLRSANLVAWVIFSARVAPDDAPAITTSLGKILLDKVDSEHIGHKANSSLGAPRIVAEFDRHIDDVRAQISASTLTGNGHFHSALAAILPISESRLGATKRLQMPPDSQYLFTVSRF